MTATADVRLRVTVPDAWDTVVVSAGPDETLAGVKAGALDAALGRRVNPDEYLLKYRGALVLDELRTVGDLAPPDGAPLIALSRRRRPVR